MYTFEKDGKRYLGVASFAYAIGKPTRHVYDNLNLYEEYLVNPYTWDGKEYKMQSHVAKAAKTSRGNANSHIKRNGSFDQLRTKKRTCKPRITNLTWNGKTYPTAKAVAKASGFTLAYVYRLIEQGKL